MNTTLALAEQTPAPVPVPNPRGGPRTLEGKERARRNALKHGLRSKTLLPDDLADAVAARTIEFSAEFTPQSPYETWLVGQLALAATRLERCAALAVADLQRRVDRAELCWEGDRRQLVEDLGATLANDPARISMALARTRQGADWMIERWEGLGEVLQAEAGWDDARRALAFDLLGVPPELREGRARLLPAGDPKALAALVARQIDRLREDQEAVLDALDDAEREMAAAGMPMDEDAPTSRMKRYEAACRRDFRWNLNELRRVQAQEPAPMSPPAPPVRSPSPREDALPVGSRPRPRLELATPMPTATPAPAPALAPASLLPVHPPERTASAPTANPVNRRTRRFLEKQERRQYLLLN